MRWGTLLACAEMLRGGITCFNEMYFFPEAALEAALAAGMRAVWIRRGPWGIIQRLRMRLFIWEWLGLKTPPELSER